MIPKEGYMAGIRDYSPQKAVEISFPKAGCSYYDPVFGNKVYRVTDENHGTQCVHYYYWSPVFNCDETKMLIFRDWNPWIFNFNDGEAKPAFSLCDVDGAPRMNAMSAQWTKANPDVLFTLDDGNVIYRIDVTAGQATQYRSFQAELPGYKLDELNMADSGLWYSFRGTGPNGEEVACVWDRQTDGIRTFPKPIQSGVHSTQISRDGQWLTVYGSYPVAETAFWRWADGHIEWIYDTDRTPHGNVNHIYDGRSVIVGGYAPTNGICTRRWEDFNTVTQIFPFTKPDGTDNWSMAHHVVARGPYESSVICSTYGGDGNAGTNEIIEIPTNGSSFRRLAHTYSAGKDGNYTGDNYWRQPRANVSPSGRWAVWTSDLGQEDRTDVLCMELPPDALNL